MKTTITISFLIICLFGYSQTMIPATTTIQAINQLKSGSYEFQQSKDTVVDFSLTNSVIVSGFTTIPGMSYDATNWNITGTVVLKSNVKWKGGHFTGTGAAFSSNGNCQNTSVDSVLCDTTIAYLIEGNVKPFVTYNGNDSTFLYYNLSLSDIQISGNTIMYDGTFEGPKTFHDVNYGMTWKNITRTYIHTKQNLLIASHSIYNFLWNGGTLVGDEDTTQFPLVDNGIVQLNSGNGTVKNVYRTGKQYGYLMRCWGVKLGTKPDPQDTYVQNCVDVNTVCYGTLDFRIDPTLLQSKSLIPLKGCNVYFINNNSANKTDRNAGYVTNAVILGSLVDDLGMTDTLFLNHDIAVNAFKSPSGMDGGSSLLKDNSSGLSRIDSISNIDYAPGKVVPAGILDSNYYSLITGVGAQAPNQVNPCPIPKIISYITITFSDGTTLKTKP